MANGMIGGMGLSHPSDIAAAQRAGLFGGLGDFGADLATGGMFSFAKALLPNVTRQSTTSTSQSRFDRGSLPFLLESIARADKQAGRAGRALDAGDAARRAQAERMTQAELAAIRGLFNQERSNTNARYNAAANRAANNNLLSMNSTIGAGNRALVNRERNRALGNIMGRQIATEGGIAQRRTNLFDNISAQAQQRRYAIEMNKLGMRGLLPSAVAANRNQRNTSTSKSRSWLF